WGGDELGQSLRWSTNTVNRLSQYTGRTVPGYVGVSGEAAEAATVTLWWGSNEWARAIQQGRYWYGEAVVNNATGSVWVVITNLGVVRGQPDRVQSETRSAFVPQTPELLIHDLDGNLVRDGRWLYYWDAENRLTRVITVAGPSSSFRRVEWKYDAWGRRTRQTSYVLSNGVWQVVEDLKFVSDPELFGRHIAELNATNNALVRAYVWGLDLSETLEGAGGVGGLLWVRMATGPAAGTHFVTYDGNGNVWNLVSASTGTETARYEYGPFGEPVRLSGPAARTNPFRFSTERTEDFTGLLLYEYRAYSPSLGRWLSRDLIEEAGGHNLKSMLANDPVAGTDAMGLDAVGKAYQEDGMLGHAALEVAGRGYGFGHWKLRVFFSVGTTRGYEATVKPRRVWQLEITRKGKFKDDAGGSCCSATAERIIQCAEYFKRTWEGSSYSASRNCRSYVNAIIRSCCLVRGREWHESAEEEDT
ncbi:RHS repeat-associated core domain-containing protein, partial [Limisphaera sp. 4302-co]|uniref:RHS repeat-associated core domain-containing protein n=1 Tax=Limisphaera sp. 4302-co TaxID=3400417 RepID=UPI003C167219